MGSYLGLNLRVDRSLYRITGSSERSYILALTAMGSNPGLNLRVNPVYYTGLGTKGSTERSFILALTAMGSYLGLGLRMNSVYYTVLMGNPLIAAVDASAYSSSSSVNEILGEKLYPSVNTIPKEKLYPSVNTIPKEKLYPSAYRDG